MIIKSIAEQAELHRFDNNRISYILHIMAGDILDTIEHPNQERYPGQQIHAIAIEDYVYLVPFVESEEEVFLKTVIPSRKATKMYRGAKK